MTMRYEERMAALMDGPPARAPERVQPGMALRGRALAVHTESGEWVRDTYTAVTDPYWQDRSQPWLMWPTDGTPPEGVDPGEAALMVQFCATADWYEWGVTKRRPKVYEWPAYLVWAE